MLTPFTLTAAPGGSTLTVAGEDLTDRVARVLLAVDGVGIPELTVEVRGTGDVTGEGVVTVVREPSGEDLMGAVADWLESLDPAQVVPVVESRFTVLNQSPIALTVQVLADLAREASGG